MQIPLFRFLFIAAVTLVLSISAFAQESLPVVTGIVYDHRGKAVRNAYICFYHPEYLEKHFSSKNKFPQGASRCRKTDRSGAYLLFLPDYSPYVLLAQKKGHWVTRVVSPTRETDTLFLSDTLKPTGSVSFHVAIEEGSDHQAYLSLQGTPFFFEGNSNGLIQAKPLPEGSYAAVITAKKAGYKSVRCSLRVRSNHADNFSDTLLIPKERVAYSPDKMITLTKEPPAPSPDITVAEPEKIAADTTIDKNTPPAGPSALQPKRHVNSPPSVTAPGDTFIGIFDPLTLTGSATDDKEIAVMEWDIGATGSFTRCENGTVQLPPHKAPIDRLTCIFRVTDNEGATVSDTTVVRVGLLWARLSAPMQLQGASGYSFLPFKDALWIIGGHCSDVWSSRDGQSWMRMTKTAQFGKLFGHTTVAFRDRLWVTGGKSSPDTFSKAIWSSPIGASWKRETTPPFTPRHYHGATVFNDKMWIIGGLGNSENTPILNDIWSSEDGIHWKLVTEHAPFSPRYGFGCTVFQNKLTIVGGFNDAIDQQQCFGDVWQSSDGIEWNQVTENAPFSKEHYHSVITYDNKLWVIGGYIKKDDIDQFTDILYTSDGKSWINLTPQLSGGGRFFCTAAVLGNHILVNPSESRELWLMR